MKLDRCFISAGTSRVHGTLRLEGLKEDGIIVGIRAWSHLRWGDVATTGTGRPRTRASTIAPDLQAAIRQYRRYGTSPINEHILALLGRHLPDHALECHLK